MSGMWTDCINTVSPHSGHLSATDNLADPVWRQKMSGMWTDCIDAAEPLPQSLLDNNPISRMMGPLARFNCFMKCKKECTHMMCGAAQAEKLTQKFGYGNFDASEFGA